MQNLGAVSGPEVEMAPRPPGSGLVQSAIDAPASGSAARADEGLVHGERSALLEGVNEADTNTMDDPLNKIREYVVENFLFGEGDGLEDDTSFLESGTIDSMGFLELVTFLEESFGFSVDDSELVPENFDSLKRVSAYVQGKIESPSV